jgi:S-adenosylmethionine decarboxylase
VNGTHVKIAGTADGEILSCAENIAKLLHLVVQRLRMRPLGEAVIHDVELDITKMGVVPFEDEGGITGILVLSTSHCAIHTWPLSGTFVFDIFSCRSFNPLLVLEDVVAELDATEVTFHIVPKGGCWVEY